MKKIFTFIPILALGFCLTSWQAGARTLYVSPNGNDGNDGTISNPWKKISYALAQAQPGDTIFLRGGVYKEDERLITTRSGNPGAPITLMNFIGEIPIIDTTAISASGWGIAIRHDYISIIGLKIRNFIASNPALWIGANGDQFTWVRDIQGVIIRNCEISHCLFGIGIDGGVHDFVIDSCNIHGFTGDDAFGIDATADNGHDIYNGIISNCKSSSPGADIKSSGYQLGHITSTDSATQYRSFHAVHDVHLVNCLADSMFDGFDISGYNNILDRCVAHHTFGDAGFKLWGMSVTLMNCLSYDNNVNVELDGYLNLTPPPHATLYNCTFVNSVTYNINLEPDSARLKMYNCIVVGGNNICFNSETTFDKSFYIGDYNIFSIDPSAGRIFADGTNDMDITAFRSQWTNFSGGSDSHSIVIDDPTKLFLDTTARNINLHLKESSPAISAGIIIPGETPVIDFDGKSRNGGKNDIGAYKYTTTGAVHGVNSQPENNVQIFPNPARENLVTIRYSLLKPGNTTIRIIDFLGNTVSIPLDAREEAGEHSLELNTTDFPFGTYFCRVSENAAYGESKFQIIR